MALINSKGSDINQIEIQYLDRWFANIVDNSNFNIDQIVIAVPALENVLQTLDTAPIEYLKDSLNTLVTEITGALDKINDKITDLDVRLKAGGL